MPKTLNHLELEANIFRIFLSLWYLPLVKISKKSMRYEWHALDNLAWKYPVNHLFLSATVTTITVKIYFTHFIAAVVRETYSFIKIMQFISPNYNWENGVKQIRLLKKICHKSCILCQLLRTKTVASGSKCIKHFFYFYRYSSYICWADVIYLTCHVFLKSP